MEAEKSHNLPSVIWRPRKASSSVWLQRPKNEGTHWYKSQSQNRRDEMSHLHQWSRKRSDFLLGLPCALFRPSHKGEGCLLCSVNWFKCQSHPETIPQTHLQQCLIWEHCGQSRWHLKGTIMVWKLKHSYRLIYCSQELLVSPERSKKLRESYHQGGWAGG